MKKKRKKMKKSGSVPPIATSLYESFPDSPRAQLNAIATEVNDKLSKQWRALSVNCSSEQAFGRLYWIAGQMLESITQQSSSSGYSFACKTGCSHCCKSEEINLSFDEIIHIAGYMMGHFNQDSFNDLQINVASAGATRTLPNPYGIGHQCVFLVDNKCSVHNARPMSCRSYFSVNEEDCKNVLRGGVRKIITVPNGRAVENTFWSKVRPSGVKLFEINQAFKYLLSSRETWNGLDAGTTTEKTLVEANVPYLILKNGNIPVHLV